MFYRAVGQANGAFVEIRRPGYILEPILQVNPLDTQVTMTSTGTRESLASLLNPGPLGDFPALLGLAIAGLPPIPYPGYPLTVKASHPVTPEANLGLGDLPGGAASDTLSARLFTSTAKASVDSAEARGTGVALNLAAGLIKVGGFNTSTKAVDDGGMVTITATSELGSIDIAGLVHIDGLKATSTARIDSEGTHIESATVIGRITALGAELRVDGAGLHVVTILGIPAPPPVILEPITKTLTDALTRLGLVVRLADGAVVDGPADGTTTVLGGARGLEISLPITIPPEVPIPSLPIPLGIPLGGGVPTTVTVALGRTQIAAVAGSGAGFDADSIPDPGTGSPIAGPATGSSFDGGPIGAGGLDLPPTAGSGAPRVGAPTVRPEVPVIVATTGTSTGPDLTPGFRWTLLTGLAVVGAGWPLARRRVAGVSGLSAAAVVRSLIEPRRTR